MNIDAGVVKHPRRLVVSFGYYDGGMIRTDDGDRPQLVHFQKKIEKPSLLIRFATRLGLTKGNKPMMDAVKETYAFVTGNYRQGDQVTLLVWSAFDRNLDAAEMLAKHLHDGTRPGDLLSVRSKNVGDVPPGRIPIHCVAVDNYGERSSVSEWNNALKSRFPAGVEHIICWDYENGSRSCATRYDVDGKMFALTFDQSEICITGGDYDLALRLHCTKHVIYYDEHRIPKWDDHEPVWTHRLDSSTGDVQGGLPLEATRPFGMYVHDLRKYQGLPGIRGDGSMLVWKSYRSASEHN
ncbi:unnamed protein product [Rhizoctonia solani]|uniref:Uncharacterized protein n=1 Tax=Rhizoctonia solani TaxID=456999 RepID=A0A8H3A2W7_9AGAM|nr:unnamed protein product [Rhizoctonia solani]